MSFIGMGLIANLSAAWLTKVHFGLAHNFPGTHSSNRQNEGAARIPN